MTIILRMPERVDIEDPPANWPMHVARTLQRGNPLDREIVMRLVARPRRYAELQPLLRGRGKNNLTQALKRLRLEGVVHMRTDVLAEPPVDYYELTGLGAQAAIALGGREYFDYLAKQAASGWPTSRHA